MTVKNIPSRKDIPEEHRWDLSPLFNSDEEWEKLFLDIENKITGYNSFKGKMHESLETFRQAIEFDLSISREIEKIYTYAHLKNDEDKANQVYLGLYQRAINLYTRISELSSFMTPEIQSIPEDVINGFIKDKSMGDYRFYMEKILRFKPHTLSKEIEQILAMSQEMAQAPSQAFSQLDNADLKFGTLVDGSGKEIELSHGNFSSFLIDKSREIRKKAFFQYYKTYREHENTISTTLSYSNKKDVFYSRVRNFENSRKAALFSDNVPEEVYDNLIKTVTDNTGPLFKYLKFRKKALSLDELHFYDTYVPLVDDITFHMTYEEAVDVCIQALEPLGDEYTRILRQGLLGGWVDRYENRGKRSGAYSSGCYDSPPYILMNYKEDNINSLYTLMHEAGHSMHSYFSIKNQPYVNHGYTIFVAEVASTFNETLLSNYLIKKFSNDIKMRAYIYNREIDNIRATLFRQTMFAEFEKRTHTILEKNRPLILNTLTEIYRELLEKYFGDTIKIDDELTLECLRIPHFYSAYYVYKYATGISAAIALADKVINEGKSAVDKYLNFLKVGGSEFPLDELNKAGVDMSKPGPIEKAISHFSNLVDEFIKIFEEL